MNVRLINVKNIINEAYQEWAYNKKGWGSTLSKRLSQVARWKDLQIENFTISFKIQMKKFINNQIINLINNEDEKVISFRKKSNNKEGNIFLQNIYGYLYKIINNKIEEIIGNPYNHWKLIFINKKELIEKVCNSEKVKKDQEEKLIKKIWNSVKQ